MLRMDESTGPLSPVRSPLRRRVRRLVLALAAVTAAGVSYTTGSGPALAQTDVLDIRGTWSVGAELGAATPTTDVICLVPCGGGTDILCAPPDANGQVRFALAESIAASSRCVQGVARNSVGTSGLSANKATLTARKPGDCNGDGKVTVSDFICVNSAIFAGG